jgi:hypothetical protein
MTRGQPFWMVCRMPAHPGSVTEPRTRYPHADAARQAARDLADRNGHPFVILETVEIVHPRDQRTISLF